MRASLYFTRPFQLPYREIRIAMKADQDTGCRSRISDHEPD